jgi:hypothetical protein
MTIDLESSLDQLAQSVHDDAVAARMNGQVHRMVTQIRRRRAARYTATGVVSVGAVAAVAVGALRLADPGAREPVAPATEGNETEDRDGDLTYDVTGLDSRFVCGVAAPEPTNLVEPGLRLIPEIVEDAAQPGANLTMFDVTVLNGTTADVDLQLAETVVVAALHDGVVVAITSNDHDVATSASLGPDTGATVSAGLYLTGCATTAFEPLPPGDYELVAALSVEDLTHGTVVPLVSGPLPFTLEAGDSAVAEILAQAGLTGITPDTTAGTCGTIVGPSAGVGSDPPLELTLDLESGTGLTYRPGSVILADVTVATRRSRSVIGNAATVGALIVLTRNGVVVGRGQWDPPDVDVIDLGPDDTVTISGSGQVLLCSLPGADAPTVDLPSGVYQAYAVLDVTLKEVTESGGESRSVTETVTVVSQPVEVIVDTPAG